MQLRKLVGIFNTQLALAALASWAAVAGLAIAADDIPRTPWGDPDLRGTWDFATIAPLERPETYKDKEFITLEDKAAIEKYVADRRVVPDNTAFEGQGDVDVGYNSFFLDGGSKFNATMRTSQIIDPNTGYLPARTQEAKDRRKAWQAALSRPPRGPEDRTPAERCLLGFNSGPPYTPGAYNNFVEIFQTRDNVAFHAEMVNDHRVIPTLPVPPLPDNMRLWKGNSSGAWDGDTFVVVTTNFNPQTRAFGTTEDLKLTEKFKRLSKERLLYQYTIDDTRTYATAWTGEFEMVLTDKQMFEYACHEGNYAMPMMLEGARKEEREGKKDDTWLPTWHRG